MGKHLLTPLFAEPVQPLAAQLQQRVALAVAHFLGADQAGEPIAIAGDAVAGEHPAHHPFPRIRRAMSCAGACWLLPGKSVAQQLQEHQLLVDGAHAHALGDGVPEALVGGGGVWGHGGPRQGSRSEPGRISAFTRASNAFT